LVCEQRDALMQHLQAKGIGCAVYYPLPLHIQECFSSLGYKAGDLPVAEDLAAKVLSLPIYPELTQEMKQYVVDSIQEFFA
jgi:dTDP-4-amino-4,6-dideoxygalactose transaminase